MSREKFNGCKSEFHEGSIVEFRNPDNGLYYDGVVWRIIEEDSTNVSLFVRFIDLVNNVVD